MSSERKPQSEPCCKGAKRVDSEPASGAPVRLLTPDGGVPRVLVVDDDALIRTVVLRALRRSGLDTTVAASGGQALELMNEPAQRFDVALVDTTMPGMSGVDALIAMRRVDPRLRAALISGLDPEQARADQVAAGAQAVLAKPFGPRELLETIARLLYD